jgi:hypothetical protein
MEDHKHDFSVPEIVAVTKQCVPAHCYDAKPVLVPPPFWTFLAGLLPQTLQNLLAVMLVKCLAWRNKFVMNSALPVKKDH